MSLVRTRHRALFELLFLGLCALLVGQDGMEFGLEIEYAEAMKKPRWMAGIAVLV